MIFLTMIAVFCSFIIITSNICFRIMIKDICFKNDLVKKASYELELGNINTSIYYAVNAGIPHLEILKIIDNSIQV